MSKLELVAFERFTKQEWDDIVISFNGSIYYSYWFLNYVSLLNKAYETKNISYAIKSHESIIAIVPLHKELIDNQWRCSYNNQPICSPLFDNKVTQKEIIDIYEFIISNLENISSKFMVPALNLLLGRNYWINYYTLFGFQNKIDFDWYIYKCDFSYIIALKDRAISDIRANIRNSFKSLINKTEKNTNLIVLDSSNPNRELFDRYKEMHFEIKGQNRSEEAFDEDFKAICNGFETILICEYKDSWIGVVVLYTFNKKAVYNSAMQRYEYDKIYPNHFLMWKSIEYLYEKECEYFLNGEQVTENAIYKPTEKEKNLSYFKKAWGGELFPWMKAEKKI